MSNICSDHSECVNTRGSYFCRCLPGWTDNGRTCKGVWALCITVLLFSLFRLSCISRTLSSYKIQTGITPQIGQAPLHIYKKVQLIARLSVISKFVQFIFFVSETQIDKENQTDCHKHNYANITWPLTSRGKTALSPCPDGTRGTFRICRQ